MWGWDDTTGTRTFTYDTLASPWTSYGRAVAWSPDGKWLASGFENTVKVRNATTGAVVAQYAKHSASVMALAWSLDSTYLASGGYDSTIQIWKATTGSTMLHADQKHIVTNIAWSPDGKRLATGWGDVVQIWQV